MNDGHPGKSTAFLGANLYSLTIWLAVFLLPFFLLSCDSQKKESYTPVYESVPTGKRTVLNFGVLPIHNPQRLYETFGPLVEYLSRNLPGITITIEASRSYEEFDKKLANRHFDFALPNPYQTINSLQHGYHVFAKMGDDDKFRGLIIARKDSGINGVADLKGKIVSFPAPTALAATIMPLYYLHTHGLDVNQDIKRLFSGSLESSIMNVYRGKSAAGGTWLPLWQTFVELNPRIAAELEVMWETPPLLNNGLVARDDVPPEIVDKLRSLFLALSTHDEGRQLLVTLSLTRFENATDETYQPVRDFMKKYYETVH